MIVGIEGFQSAAKTLGLRLEAPEMGFWRNYNLAILEGTIDGTRIFVQQGQLTSDRGQLRVYFHAAVDPPLDLGLKISMAASGYTSSAPLGPEDVHGSAAFNAAFLVESAEPERARAFFTDEMRTALIAWHNSRRLERYSDQKAWMEFWVSDESVILRLEPNVFGWGYGTPLALQERGKPTPRRVASRSATRRFA